MNDFAFVGNFDISIFIFDISLFALITDINNSIFSSNSFTRASKSILLYIHVWLMMEAWPPHYTHDRPLGASMGFATFSRLRDFLTASRLIFSKHGFLFMTITSQLFFGTKYFTTGTYFITICRLIFRLIGIITFMDFQQRGGSYGVEKYYSFFE